MASGNQYRFQELEGLRGVAAIMVAVYHNLLAFYSVAFLGLGTGFINGQNMKYEDNLYGNPLMVLLSGTFAVAIFFVLSGFVLSVGFFQKKDVNIVKKLASKRYLRLMIPALVSILIAYVLMKTGLGYTQQAASLTHSGWLLNSWNFAPSIITAVCDAVGGIFVNGTDVYNGALWTMTTEFIGSFLVFGFLALFANTPYRRLINIILIIVTFNTWFMPFLAGMLLADLYTHGLIAQKKRGLKLIPLVLVGLFLAGYPYADKGAENGIYRLITIPSLTLHWQMIYVTFGAIIIVAAVLATKQAVNIFSHAKLNWLGKYTFSLYLTHLSILYSFTLFLFVVLRGHLHLPYNEAVLISMACSVPVVILATRLFEKYVDSRSIQFSGYISKILLGEIKIPPHLISDFYEGYATAYNKTFSMFAKGVNSHPEQEITP